MGSTFEESAAEYYDRKLRQHGATPAGVDWNSAASQQLRFEQLLKVCPSTGPYSLLDYGCGYGALLGVLRERGLPARYWGYDVAASMIARAKELHGESDCHGFTADIAEVPKVDITIASGIFNVKQDAPADEWKAYILETLRRIASVSERGFSFNMLTSYSDPEKMRPDLYFGNPCFFFDYCKRNFSRQVALLHDYGLYEFTILVRVA